MQRGELVFSRRFSRNQVGRVVQPRQRCGITLLEVLFLLAVISFILLLATPRWMAIRETSRRTTCQQRLKNLTLALRHYADVHRTLPCASQWSTARTGSLALHRSRRIDVVTETNWAVQILPFLDGPRQIRDLSIQGAIGNPENRAIRELALAEMNCPSDTWNTITNRFQFHPAGKDDVLEFARGNYAINGGTQNFETDPPTTTSPHGDYLHLEMNSETRQYAMWGNGIAGINRAFAFSEFDNDQGSLIALEEIRAGIHPLDPRGVWMLGQIGSSICWGHGANGDDAGPNNPWMRADDILNCNQLHQALGTEELNRRNMPCVDYVDVNQQATSRSQHPGGVSVSLLDGSVRFIANSIDPGLWHVLHSRETPAAELKDWRNRTPPQRNRPMDVTVARDEEPRGEDATFPNSFSNSIGQTFVRIRAGTFQMGTPDRENSTALPPEAPPHPVIITRDYWLGVHEVTRNQYRRIMGMNGESRALEPSNHPPSDETSGTLPMADVSWNEAREFCRRLTFLDTERKAGRAYRLPTEAEWEYACRAGEETASRWHGSRLENDFSGDAAGMIPPLPVQPVGSWPANRWGVFDLRGNVWEWTSNWYARDDYVRSSVHDPQGPGWGMLKVVRGSDWRFVGETCHIDAVVMPPWKRNPLVGFRVVCFEQSNVLSPVPARHAFLQ